MACAGGLHGDGLLDNPRTWNNYYCLMIGNKLTTTQKVIKMYNNPVERLGQLISLYQRKGVTEPSYYASHKNYEIEVYYSAINDCVVLTFVTKINELDTNVIIYNPIVSDSLYDAKIISQNSNRNTGGILIDKKILATLV